MDEDVFGERYVFKDSSELTEISIMEQKKIGDASYASRS